MSSTEYPWGTPAPPPESSGSAAVVISRSENAAPPRDPSTPVSAPDMALLPRADVGSIYADYQHKAETLAKTAETIKVVSVEDKAGMEMARTTRLALRRVRIDAEKKRKEMVEGMTRATERINSAAREVRRFCEEHEERLQALEDFAAREALRIEHERRVARAAEIEPFLSGPLAVDLGKITDAEYQDLLATTREIHELREARRREEEAEAERKRIEAEAERQRLAAENARLVAEAEAKRKAEAEERRQIEERRQKRQTYLNSLPFVVPVNGDLGTIRDDELLSQIEAARKNHEETTARAAERAEIERKAAEAENARKAAEEKLEAERRKIAAEAEEKRKAKAVEAARLAAAPDAEKLLNYVNAIEALRIGAATTDKGKEIFARASNAHLRCVAELRALYTHLI